MARAVIRGGITVAPHVQAFAQALVDELGPQSIGTYNGHDPDAQHAIDVFCPVDDPEPARAILQFTISNARKFEVWYTISRQRIWNVERAGEGLRWMADRGSNTANHYDHNHISFYQSPGEELEPEEDMGIYDAVDREKLDTVVADVRHLKTVFDELKREIGEGLGQPNWHMTGEAVSTIVDTLFNMLADIKKDVEELKAR